MIGARRLSDTVTLGWRDVIRDPSISAPGEVSVRGRGIDVNVARLEDDRYTVELTLRRRGGIIASARREFFIRRGRP